MSILNWRTPPLIKDLLSLIAGALLVLAFAPINFSYLAVLSPALLIVCWMHTSAKRAFWRGWLYGVGLYGAGVSWVYVSIHVYGQTPVPLALALTLSLVGCLALYPALQGYLLNKLFPRESSSKWLLAFPASWVLFEWLRSWLLTGFPWLLVAYSQTESPLSGLVPVVGVYGLAFLLTLASGLFICFFRLWRRRRKQALICLLGLVLLYGGAYSLKSIAWTHTSSELLQVTLVQGNIPQDLKWSPAFVQDTLETYQHLTQAHWDSQIIVWPEAAIPLPMNLAENFINALASKAEETDTALILGIPVNVPNMPRFYNAVIAIGQGEGHYYKRHLVPFGEYVPLEQSLRGVIEFFDLPMSNMISGPKGQPMLQGQGIKIATFICYEIAYSSTLHTALPEAELLITVSNDAWFGDSLAPSQHLQIAQFQSLQTGRYQLFASNDGITAIISPEGKIIKQAPQFITTSLTGQVQAMQGVTPWIKTGNGPLLSLMFILIGVAVYLSRRH